MKKLLIALLALTGAVAFAPRAQAERHVNVWNGHCYVAVPRYSHCEPRYRSDHYGSSNRYSSNRYYSKSDRYYRSNSDRYYRNNDDCDRRGRHSNSRPRVAINFGF